MSSPSISSPVTRSQTKTKKTDDAPKKGLTTKSSSGGTVKKSSRKSLLMEGGRDGEKRDMVSDKKVERSFSVTYDEGVEPIEDLTDEEPKAKRKRDRETPLMSVLKANSGILNKMSDSVSALSRTQTSTPATPDDADRLWALSLVQHMKRMDQSVKDKFVLHVMKTAFEAISGEWPKKTD